MRFGKLNKACTSTHLLDGFDPCVCLPCRSNVPFRQIANAIKDASDHASPSSPRSLLFRSAHTGPAEIADAWSDESSSDDDDGDGEAEDSDTKHDHDGGGDSNPGMRGWPIDD